MSHSLFCRQGGENHTKIEGVIADVLIVIVVSTTGQAQYLQIWILGEAPTKGPLKGGEPITDKYYPPFECKTGIALLAYLCLAQSLFYLQISTC